MPSVTADGYFVDAALSRDSVTPRPTYRSFKKKYNKMRHEFKENMRISNTEFDEEQKALTVARRLQEQNDQILNLLLEINETSRIAPHLRYDLRSPILSESLIPALEPDLPSGGTYDVNSAHAAIEEAKEEMNAGQITSEDYKQIEAAFNSTAATLNSLSQLCKIPHTVLESLSINELPFDSGEPDPTGYLSVEHEEEYLAELDADLDGSALGTQPAPDSHPIRSMGKEKEAQLRNPVSVYNWLRKHQPGVFLQDSDTSPDKHAPKTTNSSKPSKRFTIAVKPEPEAIDEDGIPIFGPPESTSRSKRKREDEPYRPKGGSSRPTKKKKISTSYIDKTAGEEHEF